MTILGYGTTPADFTVEPQVPGGGTVTLTTAAAKIADEVSQGLAVGARPAAFDFDPPQTPSVLWARFSYYADGAPTTGEWLLIAYGPSQLNAGDKFSSVLLRGADGGKLQWQRTIEVPASIANFGTAFDPPPQGQVTQVDIKINRTTGEIETYYDGVLEHTATYGATLPQVTRLAFRRVGVGADTVYSALIIADEDTRALAYPESPGAGIVKSVRTSWEIEGNMTLYYVANAEGRDGLQGAYAAIAANTDPRARDRAYRLLNLTDNLQGSLPNIPRVGLRYVASQNFPSNYETASVQRPFVEFSDESGLAVLRFYQRPKADGVYVEARSVDASGNEATLFLSTTRVYTRQTGQQDTFPNLGAFVIDYSISASGFVRAYLDDVLLGEFVGNTRFNGGTAIGRFKIQSPVKLDASWNESYIRRLICADQDLRYFDVFTLAPSGNGDINEWSGTYAALDEQGEAANDYMSTTVADKQYLVAMSDVPVVVGTPVVNDVIVRSVIQAATDGPQHVQQQVKTNTQTVQAPSQAPSVGAFVTIEDHFPLNPATGAKWTLAELNALQVGAVSRA